MSSSFRLFTAEGKDKGGLLAPACTQAGAIDNKL